MATMINPGQIKDHMQVVCSEGGPFGTVDGVEGNTIKLTKDDQGQHHWIPLDWVTRVDQHVHVDRPVDQAMHEWMTSPPQTQGILSGATDTTSASPS